MEELTIEYLTDALQNPVEKTSDLLERLRSELKQYRELDLDSKKSQWDLSSKLYEFGRILYSVDRYAEAAEVLEETVRIQQEVYPDAIGFVYHDLADSYSKLGQYEKAELTHSKGLQCNRQRASKSKPSDKEEPISFEIAASLSRLGRQYKVMGRYEEAKIAHKEAIDILLKLINQIEENSRDLYNPLITREYYFLGNLYKDFSFYVEAEIVYEEILTYYREQYENIINSKYTSIFTDTFTDLGNVYAKKGRYVESEKAFEEAINIFNNVVKRNSKNPKFWRNFAHTFTDLGNLYKEQGQFIKAERSFRNALTIFQKLTEIDQSLGNEFSNHTNYDNIAITAGFLAELYAYQNQAVAVSKPNSHEASNNFNTEEWLSNGDIVTDTKDKENKLFSKKTSNINYDLYTFSEPLSEILEAIQNGSSLNGLNLLEKIQDSNFRFKTKDFPEISLQVSHVIAKTVEVSRPIYSKKASKIGALKRNENADEFAQKIFNTIKQLQTEEKVSSYRETVAMLNKKNVATYNGGEWHLKTLQDLNKRWKQLGLISKPK